MEDAPSQPVPFAHPGHYPPRVEVVEVAEGAFGHSVLEVVAPTIACFPGSAPRKTSPAVVFLSSDAAECITGQVLSVDGGLLGHVPHLADQRRRPVR